MNLGLILLLAMLYGLVGLLRTMFKTAKLAHEGKINARNDDIAAFKYMIKHPTIGDVIFLPVQVGFLAAAGIVYLGLKFLFFLAK